MRVDHTLIECVQILELIQSQLLKGASNCLHDIFGNALGAKIIGMMRKVHRTVKSKTSTGLAEKPHSIKE